MNTRDNPALWDIQLSTWVFCEFNVSGYVLVYSASSWFQGITRCTQRWFSPSFDTQTFITLLWPTAIPAGFRCNKHHTCVCSARYIAMRSDHWHDRQRFSIARLPFPTQGNARLDTYTQHDKLWRRKPHSIPGTWPQHVPVFSVLYANFWDFLLLASEQT